MLLFISQTLSGNPTKETQPTTSSYFQIIVIFLMGVLVGAISIYLYSRWKIYTILSVEKRLYLESLKDTEQKYFFKYIGIIEVLKKRKEEIKEEIKDLNFKNSELKKDLNKFNTVSKKTEIILENKRDSWENNDAETISQPIDLKIEPLKSSVSEIYFEIPEVNGTFKTQDGKNNQTTYSFYKIVKDKDSLKGKIYFLSGSLDLRALGNIDNYLNPVCEIENIGDRIQAKNIKMINPGTVQLNGDTWKIDANNKVKIKLI